MSKDISIELSVRVTDGSYESRLLVPISANKEQMDNFAAMWIQALGQAVKLTSERTPNDRQE